MKSYLERLQGKIKRLEKQISDYKQEKDAMYWDLVSANDHLEGVKACIEKYSFKNQQKRGKN